MSMGPIQQKYFESTGTSGYSIFLMKHPINYVLEFFEKI